MFIQTPETGRILYLCQKSKTGTEKKERKTVSASFLNVTFHIALEQFGLLIRRTTFVVACFFFYRSIGRKRRGKNIVPDRQGTQQILMDSDTG